MRKVIVDSKSLTDFVNCISEFVKCEITPSVYDKSDTPENEMQKHLSDYMSRWYDVLREVTIPSCDKKEDWEVDESMSTKAADTFVFYTGELKIHARNMDSGRDYVKEVKDDIDKMICVAEKYYDVTLGYILFVSVNKQEIDEIIAYATTKRRQTYQPKVKENGYYSVIVSIVPSLNRDHTAPKYLDAWNKRFENVKNDGTEKENFFKRSLIRLKK